MTLPANLFLQGAEYRRREAAPAPMAQLYRCPHDKERDLKLKYIHGKRDGLPWYRDFQTVQTDVIPAPFRLYPDQTVAIKNKPALIDLLCELNPEYTRERVMFFLDIGLIWCNIQWGVFHAPLVTGGAVLEAERVANGRVYFKSILLDGPVPTADQVIVNHMSYIATCVRENGDIQEMRRANGHGSRSSVRMFIVRKKPEPLWLPENELHRLPRGFEPPSALWLP